MNNAASGRRRGWPPPPPRPKRTTLINLSTDSDQVQVQFVEALAQGQPLKARWVRLLATELGLSIAVPQWPLGGDQQVGAGVVVGGSTLSCASGLRACSLIHRAPSPNPKPSTIRTPDLPAMIPPFENVRIAFAPRARSVETEAQTPRFARDSPRPLGHDGVNES
jgi:hypothetical protein